MRKFRGASGPALASSVWLVPAALVVALAGCSSSDAKGSPSISNEPLQPSPPRGLRDMPTASPEVTTNPVIPAARKLDHKEASRRLPAGVVSIKVPAPSWRSNQPVPVHAVVIDAAQVFFNDGFGRIWGARKDGQGAPFEVLAGASPSQMNPAGGVHAIDLVSYGDDIAFTASAKAVMLVAKTGGEPRAVTRGKADPVSLAADGQFLYYTSFDGSPIRRVPGGGGEGAPVFQGIKHGSIRVDAQHLFVASYAQGTVSRVPKGGGAALVLASGLPKPVGLAIDETDVYFPCESDGTVRRVAKAGGPVKILASKQVNHDRLVLDGEYVYWASWEPGGPLRRVRKDGSGQPETLITGLRAPSGLAVDDTHVYVANKGAGEVLIVPKAGVDGAVTYPGEE